MSAKRVRKVSLPRLKRDCDELWSAAVLSHGSSVIPYSPDPRYSLCAVCGESKAQASHHVFPKGANGHFRYDLRNGIPICHPCHLRDRANPALVVYRAMSYMGVNVFLTLASEVSMTRGRKVWSRKDLENIKVGLEIHLSVYVGVPA